MKLIGIPAVMALLAGSAYAHSWLECVDTIVENKDNAKAHPELPVTQTCNGYSRNKVHNGDWIAESSNYAYSFNTEFACREGQRVPGQTAPGAPMATVTPGKTITMRYWGNGHTRWDIGSPNHRDPGLVRIFWAGKPETEIVFLKDLTEKYWIPGAQGNFSGDTITELTNGGKNMNEKANYFEFTIPEKIQNGRHMMVWSWAWRDAMVDGKHGDPNVYDQSWDNAFGTCFDIVVKDSKFTDAVNTDILANQKGFNDAALSKAKEDVVCSKTCQRGGIPGSQLECTGAGCPPCWYPSSGGRNPNCFEYAPGGKCPWSGGFDCGTGAAALANHQR